MPRSSSTSSRRHPSGETTRPTKLSRIRESPTGASSACIVLLYAEGQQLGERKLLGDTDLTFGRDASNLVVVHDPAASRSHARVSRQGATYVLTDGGSTNGTYVNGRRVTEEELQDGDHIRVGRHIFKFLAGGNIEAQYHEELHRLALTDGLTQVANKRALLEYLRTEVARFHRFGRTISLIIIDLDHFKRINDVHGHVAGDALLQGVAARIRPFVRAGVECFSRFGGEEFALALPEISLEGARLYAEKVRRAIEQEPFVVDGAVVKVTVSAGAAEMKAAYQAPAQLIKAADAMLYRAKQEGRNRVAAG